MRLLLVALSLVVCAACLLLSAPAPDPVVRECVIVTGETNGYAVLRSAPSYWYGYGAGVVYDGDTATATAQSGAWLRVEADRGGGWVREEYCGR